MSDDIEKAKKEVESWELGQTSKRYETGGKGAATISTGKGDKGGVSYGSYQLSTNEGTLREYLDQSPYAAHFKGLTPATKAFNDKWVELAQTDPGFAKDQHDFIKKSHVDKQEQRLDARGIDLSDRGRAVQDLLWSTSVQFRDLTPTIFEKGLKEKYGNDYKLNELSDKQIIEAVQDYKINHNNTLFKSSPTLWNGLLKRANSEKADLLELAGHEQLLKDNNITVDPAKPGGKVDPKPQPASPMADGVLERGEKGPEVRAMQEQLIKAGITSVNGKPFVADSDYGPQTEAAVREYQRTRGLKVDGEAGPQTLDALKNNMPAKAETKPDPVQGGSNWPAPGNYSINHADKPGEGHGEFGTSRGGGVRKHKGVDIEGNVGDRIESFGPGKVIFSGQMSGYGNTVVIQHDNGLQSVYAHLNSRTVEKGDRVTQDTQVGTMGRTGNTPSKGDTHLHFEIRENSNGVLLGGTAVDPMKYLKTPDQSKEPAKPTPEPTKPSAAMADGLLKEGERGVEVRQLQEQLNKLGVRDAEGKPLKTDGIFGKHTEEAVEQLQRQRGISVDGVVGKDTHREIAAALKEQTDKQAVGAINKTEQTPKLSDANHPDHAMYKQALSGIEKLPPATFKSDEERQNAAAAIVHEAKVSGMTKIDQVVSNNNGGLYAVQGDLNADTHKRVFVDQQQAAAQTVERSTQLMDQLNQQKPPQAPQDEQVKEEQRRNSPVMA